MAAIVRGMSRAFGNLGVSSIPISIPCLKAVAGLPVRLAVVCWSSRFARSCPRWAGRITTRGGWRRVRGRPWPVWCWRKRARTHARRRQRPGGGGGAPRGGRGVESRRVAQLLVHVGEREQRRELGKRLGHLPARRAVTGPSLPRWGAGWGAGRGIWRVPGRRARTPRACRRARWRRGRGRLADAAHPLRCRACQPAATVRLAGHLLPEARQQLGPRLQRHRQLGHIGRHRRRRGWHVRAGPVLLG